MILSAFLKLDVAGFSSGMGIATEGVKGFLRIAGEVGSKLKEAFDLGGEMSDLSSQLGESAGSLLVLRQAFEDTGVGADAMAQSLGIMRRNLQAVAESGGNETFKKLGLDAKELSKMGAEDQLSAIAGAFENLTNPTEEAAVAMEVFGRGGLKMLTLLKDPAAISTASKSLGSLSDIIDKNANAFDGISDRMNRFKMKSMGLWAGIAEGLTPLMDQVTALFDGVDVAGFGRKVGAVLGTVVELFKAYPLKDVLLAGFDAGWTQFLNNAAKATLRLGNMIVKATAGPFALISALFQKAIEETMELIGKIPGVGKAMGLTGFKAGDLGDMYDEQLDAREKNIVSDKALDEFIKSLEPFKVGAQTEGMWDAAAAAFEQKLADIQAQGGSKTGTGEGGIGNAGIGSAGMPVLSDRLARIGGFVGGSGQGKLESLGEKQLHETTKMRELLEWIKSRPNAPVWSP